MAVIFKKYKLGDVINFKRGYDLPQQNRIHGNVPIFSSAGLSGYHNEFKVRGPGVITGRYGTLGELFYTEENYWPHNTTLYVTDFKGNHPKFIYYFLKTLRLDNQNDKTSVPGLNRNHLHEIEVEILDDNTTQSRIASILSAFDDKIELNRRMNQTLEQMAQALFNHYFVDNIDPDNLPEGWCIKTIEEVSTKIGMGPFGANIKVSTFTKAGMPIISGQNLNKVVLEDKKYNYISLDHAERLKNSIVQQGDIIFTHAGNIGQVSIISDKSRFEKYILSQRQFYMRPNSEMISGYYVTLYFKSFEGQHQLLSHSSSTGVPSISRPVTNLRRMKIIVPENRLLQRFDKIITSLYDRIVQNHKECETLKKLRDFLLPRLMSGEIDVDALIKEEALSQSIPTVNFETS